MADNDPKPLHELIEGGAEKPEAKEKPKTKERKKPGKETLDRQKDKVSEIFEQDLADEEMELQKMLLAEGIELTPEDFRDLYESIPDIFESGNPELGKYMRDLQPRLEKTIDETANLKAEGFDADAMNKLVEFMENEEKNVEKIKDPNARDTILAYIGAMLNIQQLAKDMKGQATTELVSNGVDMIPVIGSGKMMYECATGKTAAGEKLEGTGRVIHGGWATVSLAFDVVTVASAFASGPVGPAVSEGAKVALIGTKASVQGAKIANYIFKFAALCQRVEKLGKVSKTIFKIGALIQKYPKIAGGIVKYLKLSKKAYKVVYKPASYAYKGEKLTGKTAA